MMPGPKLTMPDRSMTIMEAAVAYLELGLLPIPVYGVDPLGHCMCCSPNCNAIGKHPVGAGWQKRAPKTRDDLRDVFGEHHGNIGILLQDSKFVLLDFDGEEGLATLAQLERDNLITPTLRARSGSGGAHLIYRVADWQDPKIIRDRRVGPKWDVKKHGQFLASPSRHACGQQYEWIDCTPIATLPDGIFDLISQPTLSAVQPPREARPSTKLSAPHTSRGADMASRARAYIATMPAAISGAGGHDATFAVARKLVQDFQLDASTSWDLLVEYNARCEPPWSESELRHKLDSAFRARVSNPIADREPTREPVRSRPVLVSVSASEPEPLIGADWKAQMLWKENRQGKRLLVTHVDNVTRILNLHPQWKGRIRFDMFRGRIVAKDPPWDEFNRPKFHEPIWTDEDATRLASWLRRNLHQFGFEPSIKDCERAVDVVARTNAFHPVREYLDSLVWDQQPRLSRFAVERLGSDDTDYVRNIIRWWFISAVARIYVPGCKADHVLIFEGNQGLGKSSALRALAGEWFSDTAIDLNSKDAYSQIRGKWIIELAELDSLFRTDSSRAKAFFSSPKDDYRPAYGRLEREQPRECVFAGTVNEDSYLRDPTGARRFWPLLCRTIDVDGIVQDRDQLWAEAVWLFRQGARWWPEGSESIALAEAQEARTRGDDWQERIVAYIARTGLSEVTSATLLEGALNLEPRDWSTANQTRVGIIMIQRLKWAKRRISTTNGRPWVFVKPE